MRIGLLTSVGATIDAFFPQIIQRWRELGHEVFTAAGTRANDPNHTTLAGLTRRPSPQSLLGPRQIRIWERETSLDVILTNTATASAIVRVSRTKAPVVYFCHGLHWDNPRAINALPWRVIERLLLPLTQGVIAINSDDETWFRSRPTNPLLWRSSVGVGLDTSRFARTPLTRFDGTIVWAGELGARKRPELAVETAAELKRRGVAFQLLILGEGPLRGSLHRMVDDLDLTSEVFFLGHSDSAYHFRQAQVVMHTAKWEGLPRVLLEAVAVGRPVVAFDTKGVRDIPTAMLVPDGDVAGMATILQEQLANPSRPQIAAQELDAIPVADDIVSLLQAVSGASR